MRKKYISLLLTLLAVFTSCDDKLDITPRGFSTLNTVDDLGALINKEWRIYDWDFNHEMITGNTFALWSTPEEIFNVKNSVEYAFIYADESVDRVALCEEDDRYKEIYSNIKYCNIVACQMPDLDGDQYKKNRFIAQARILRAWFHFLAVNLWAAQYDEATAASTGGVPYVDNIDFGAEKTKLTVAQVYEKILADCSDELIECLDKTPDRRSLPLRGRLRLRSARPCALPDETLRRGSHICPQSSRDQPHHRRPLYHSRQRHLGIHFQLAQPLHVYPHQLRHQPVRNGQHDTHSQVPQPLRTGRLCALLFARG